MSVDNTAKTSSRRGKSTPKEEAPAGVDALEANQVSSDSGAEVGNPQSSQEEPMSTDNVVQITTRPVQPESQEAEPKGAIELSKPSESPSPMVWNRPVMPSDVEVRETMMVAGVRPIAASSIQIYGTYLNNRPIMSSSIRVYDQLPGDRPIFYSDFKFVEGKMLPGDRPIMASDARLLEGSMLPGNRPIAPNNIIDEDPPALMGYLD